MVKIYFVVSAYLVFKSFGSETGIHLESSNAISLEANTFECPVGCTGSGDSCAASPVATITQALKCGGTNFNTLNGVSFYDCASLQFQQANFGAGSGYDSSWLSGCQLSYTNPGCTAKVCYGTVTNTSADSCPNYNNFVFVCHKSHVACALNPYNLNAPVKGQLTICLGNIPLNPIEAPPVYAQTFAPNV